MHASIQSSQAASNVSNQDDRRHSPRVTTIVAVELKSATRDKKRVAVSRDASANGLLVTTPSRFELGEPLTLKLYLSRGREIVEVHGHVARLEHNGPTSNEMWRYRLAIQFDEPSPPALANALN